MRGNAFAPPDLEEKCQAWGSGCGLIDRFIEDDLPTYTETWYLLL